MAFYDAGGMGEQPMGGGGGAARKPRKGGSAAAVPGQMTNTAMPGTQQLSVAPPDPGAGTFPDASGNTAPPMGSNAPMQGSLEGYRPGPMQFGGAPPVAPPVALSNRPGKGGSMAAGMQGGGVMGGMGKPGLGNRVGALRGFGGMGGGY